MENIFFLSQISQLQKCTAAGASIQSNQHYDFAAFMMLTCPCNVDPLTPHFYIVKLGFTVVYITFLFFALKHRLWVLVRTPSMRRFLSVPTIYVLSQSKKNITIFHLKITNFTAVKIAVYYIGVLV